MATTITLANGHPFPAGTTVEFVPRTLKNEPSGPVQRRGAKHKVEGMANVTAVVAASGALTPVGLTANTHYDALATVNGSPVRVACYCP